MIGRNGSGKTTAINLIAAALTGDVATLDRISFEKVELHLVNPEKKKERASVILEKHGGRDAVVPDLNYSFQVGDRKWEYLIGPIERRFAVGAYPVVRHPTRPKASIGDVLRSIANVSWLSIHRTPTRPAREGRSYESTIEKKLEELGNGLTRLFSELASRGEAETRVFEQSVFLALLPRKEWEMFNSVKLLDLDAERDGLIEIFRRFDLRESEFQQRVDEHFQLITSAIAKDSWVDPELLAVGAMWSIHQVVQGWRTLRSKQEEIFKPREGFLNVLNEMMYRKKMAINERNELYAAIGDDKKLLLSELSSGEKQLVIILGEALLQKQCPSVYIADEPELSLHVSWQEKLTANLRQVNPKAQVIFATHSPDIVAGFHDRVFDLEKLLA